MPDTIGKATLRAAGKVAAICAAVAVVIIVITFVGLNLQHAQDLRDQQRGVVKSQNEPITDKDLGKAPVQRE